ncbi:unnamed protein product, partial [Brugia timori]|uniref:Ovule protein n=1 Tax=Brugia timori TaxID=42155 RepID=A0A0R3QHC1_9BILA
KELGLYFCYLTHLHLHPRQSPCDRTPLPILLIKQSKPSTTTLDYESQSQSFINSAPLVLMSPQHCIIMLFIVSSFYPVLPIYLALSLFNVLSIVDIVVD